MMGPSGRLALLLARTGAVRQSFARSGVCLVGKPIPSTPYVSKAVQHAEMHHEMFGASRPNATLRVCLSWAGIQAGCSGTGRCLSTLVLSPLRAASAAPQLSCALQQLQFQRSFASDLPPHIEMEMPALSPTMSQVDLTPPAVCADVSPTLRAWPLTPCMFSCAQDSHSIRVCPCAGWLTGLVLLAGQHCFMEEE